MRGPAQSSLPPGPKVKVQTPSGSPHSSQSKFTLQKEYSCMVIEILLSIFSFAALVHSLYLHSIQLPTRGACVRILFYPRPPSLLSLPALSLSAGAGAPPPRASSVRPWSSPWRRPGAAERARRTTDGRGGAGPRAGAGHLLPHASLLPRRRAELDRSRGRGGRAERRRGHGVRSGGAASGEAEALLHARPPPPHTLLGTEVRHQLRGGAVRQRGAVGGRELCRAEGRR